MNTWLMKREYIRNLAMVYRGGTLHIPALAGLLNEAGYRTDAGLSYQGLRGTYTLVRSTWKHLRDQGLDDEADNVAQVFVRPDGRHAWI